MFLLFVFLGVCTVNCFMMLFASPDFMQWGDLATGCCHELFL